MSPITIDGLTLSFTPSASAILLPAFSLIFFFLNLPSLVFHITHHNLAAAFLTSWILMLLLINFLNACIWPTDNLAEWYRGEIYCDIQVKLLNASNLGTVGAVGVILRGLAKALDTTSLTRSTEEKRWKPKFSNIVDYGLCFGLPIYAAAVHYIVQPSRYYIFAISGCVVSFDNSWPTIVLVNIWPLIFSLFDAYYAGLVIYRIHIYRRTFGSILAASSSRLNKSRFKRLLAIAILFLVGYVPTQVYLLYTDITFFPLIPYSWKLVHDPQTWQEIFLLPSGGQAQLQNWYRLVMGILLWMCFGTGREGRAVTRGWAKKCGVGKIWPWVVQDPKPSSGPSFGSRVGSLGGKMQAFVWEKISRRSSLSTNALSALSTSKHSTNPSSTQGHSRNASDISENSIIKQAANVQAVEDPMVEPQHSNEITTFDEKAHTDDRSELAAALNSVGSEAGRSSPKNWLGREKNMDLESGMDGEL